MRDLLPIPKAELHVHLRGAMPPRVFTQLLQRHPVADVLRACPEAHLARFQHYANIRHLLASRTVREEDAHELFHYDSFDQFLATWSFTGCFVRDKLDLRQLVQGVIEDLRDQGVVYAEITVSAVEYISQGILLEDIADCLTEGSRADGICVRWIVDLVRDSGPDEALRMLRRIVKLQCPAVIGITLGGSEHLFPPAPFKGVYDFARDHGLRLTAHAGEASGPASIWDALLVLGVERVGHGVRAIEDPALVAYLARHRIPLEVCLTSNVRTGIFPSYAEHPVRRLFEADVPITINSDDPTFFASTLTDEFRLLRSMGMSEDAIRQLIQNGFLFSFMREAEMRPFLRDLDDVWPTS